MFNPTFLLIATSTYNQWVSESKKAIKKYFPESNIYLFGDTSEADFKITHQSWPFVTLYRFNYFLQAEQYLIGDHFYFIDIDAKFVSEPDIQGDLVAVRHCAYYFDETNIPQETNKRSVFFNYPFKHYYGGGFFGGNREQFFKLAKWCDTGINQDVGNGVIPRHNDETALNSYLSLYPPTKELTPAYHYPQNDAYFSENFWGGERPFKPVIELLDKFSKVPERQYRVEI